MSIGPSDSPPFRRCLENSHADLLCIILASKNTFDSFVFHIDDSLSTDEAPHFVPFLAKSRFDI